MLTTSQIVIADQGQENLSADFLEFLADMEEVTGDGFDDWLENDLENESRYESNVTDEKYSGEGKHE